MSTPPDPSYAVSSSPARPPARSLRARLVLHPFFLGSLALLIANDVWWKAAYGSWLTGKLSDVAGLVVAPVLLVALAPAAWRARHRLRLNVAAHALVIGGFAWVKLAPVDEAVRAWMAAAGLAARPQPVIVQDPADLGAVAACTLSAWLAAHAPDGWAWLRPRVSELPRVGRWASRVRAGLVRLVLVVAVGVALASSASQRAPQRYASSVGLTLGAASPAALEAARDTLARRDVAARWEEPGDGRLALRYLFPVADSVRTQGLPLEQRDGAYPNAFSGVVYAHRTAKGSLVLDRVTLAAWQEVDNEAANALVRRYVLAPLAETLAAPASAE